FINMQYGPDGNVYLIDWYDKQACHLPNDGIWDRNTGRIYKICYRGTKPVKVDLQKLSDKELIKLQLHQNDWYVRHAPRILQERYGSSAPASFAPPPRTGAGVLGLKGTHDALDKIAFGHAFESRRLRGLWALHATGGLTVERVSKGLEDKSPYV